jgi:hypothetical protein
MKLRGIANSKRRYAAHLKRLERERLGSASQHVATPAENGTLKCSCGGALYSPNAYARHIQGHGMIDGEAGVYTDGAFDPWIATRKTAVAPVVEQADATLVYDASGDAWQPFVNTWSQRQLRNLRTGEIKHAPAYIVRTEEKQQQVGGYAAGEF